MQLLNSDTTNFKLSFIDITIIASYVLFVCLLTLGLSGYFNRPLVIVSLLAAVAPLWFFRKKIAVEKTYFWLFIPVAIVAAGFAFARGFFAGDAYETWLSVAWETASTGSIPTFLREVYYAGMPLPSLLFAATFSLFGQHNELLNLWVPLFFTGATLWLLYAWGTERGLEKKYLYLLTALFIANQAFAQFSWSLLQEPAVLFFATATFYYLDRVAREATRYDLLLLLASITLAAASKLSGLFLLLLIPYAFFKFPQHRKTIAYGLFLLTPILAWLLRNALIFGNPVFPVLGSMFPGPYQQVWRAYEHFRIVDAQYVSFIDRMKFILPRLLSVFPFILLSTYGFYKSKKWFYLALLGIFLLLKEYFLFTPTQSATRYYYFFFGLLLIYAVVGLSKLQSRGTRVLLLLLATWGLLGTPQTDSTSIFISLWEARLPLLRSLVTFITDYKHTILLLLIPLYAKLTLKEETDKTVLTLLYGLYIVQLYFVANKTWLATWPFILPGLAIILVVAMRKQAVRLLPLTIGFLSAVVLSVSWGIGAVYALRQKNYQFPAKFVYEVSAEARASLDQKTLGQDRKSFYVLITSQPDYFNWLTDYQAINLPDLGFFKLVPEYRNDTSSQQLKELLTAKRIKYILRNIESYEFSATATKNLNIFLKKLDDPQQFTLIAQGTGWQIWQVY